MQSTQRHLWPGGGSVEGLSEEGVSGLGELWETSCVAGEAESGGEGGRGAVISGE